MDFDLKCIRLQPELSKYRQIILIHSFSTDIRGICSLEIFPPFRNLSLLFEPFIEPEPEPELRTRTNAAHILESPSEISTPAVDEDYMAQLQREMDQKFGSENPEEVSASPPVIEEAETPPAWISSFPRIG